MGHCRGTVTGTTAYIRAVSSDPSVFTMDLTLVPSAEGTGTAPMNLTGALPHAGQVGITASYYLVEGLAASTAHTVSLTGLTGNADLHVHDTAAMDGSAACSSTRAGLFDE